MDAEPFVAKALNQNPPAREQQNGAIAMGGPIVIPKLYNGKGRSFFFATYEQTHAEEQTSTSFRTLPTREFQNGDFSRLFDAGYTGDARSGTVVGTDALGRPIRFGQVYDPRSTRVVDGRVTRDPFPNNQIPRAVWDPVARNTIEQGLWDAPELDRLLNNQPQLSNCCPIFNQKTFATKIDQVINTQHRASFYLNREWRTRNNSGAGRYGAPPGSPTNLYQLQDTPSWMIRASENWVISDRLLHRFAFGYNRFGNENLSVYFNQGWPSKIGLRNQPDTHFPRFAFGAPTAVLGTLGNYGSTNRGASYEGSTIVQDDLTIVMGRHSVKTGFEGRFYYVDNETADGTATYNFNAAQSNLPGSDQQTGHSYASFLLGAVQTSSRQVQAVNTDYFQRDFALYVQDDYKVSSKLTLNLGVRWQILPGMYEKNGYVTNLDLTLPNAAAGNRPGALRFADQEGRKGFIDTYYKQIQPRLGVAYAASPNLALSGGYSSSNRPATAYSGGDDFGGLNSTGYNGTISITRTTRPTPNVQDPVMYPQRALPQLRRHAAPLRPDAVEQPGCWPGRRRQRGQARAVPQLQRDRPASTSGERLADRRLHRRAGPAAAVRQRDQPDPVRRDRAVRRSPVQPPLEPAAARDPAALPWLYGHGPAGAETLSAIHRRLVPEQLQGQDPVQLASDNRSSVISATASPLLAAYTLSKTEDNVLKQDGSGDEWALAGGGRHVPHFLKLTWIYELPIGPGRGLNVDGVLGHIVGGWTLTGIHNYRSGGTLSVSNGTINGVGYPFRPDVVSGVDPIIYDGSAVDLVRGTPYLNPAAFATQPLSAQGIPSRLGTAPPILLDVRGPAFYTEDFGLLKRFAAGGARNLEFRADFINVLNRSGLSGPETNLASPNFGKIFGVGSGPRRIQLSLRATF